MIKGSNPSINSNYNYYFNRNRKSLFLVEVEKAMKMRILILYHKPLIIVDKRYIVQKKYKQYWLGYKL